MPNQDFFITFGSDAKDFAAQLRRDLAPVQQEVSALVAQLNSLPTAGKNLSGLRGALANQAPASGAAAATTAAPEAPSAASPSNTDVGAQFFAAAEQAMRTATNVATSLGSSSDTLARVVTSLREAASSAERISSRYATASTGAATPPGAVARAEVAQVSVRDVAVQPAAPSASAVPTTAIDDAAVTRLSAALDRNTEASRRSAEAIERLRTNAAASNTPVGQEASLQPRALAQEPTGVDPAAEREVDQGLGKLASTLTELAARLQATEQAAARAQEFLDKTARHRGDADAVLSGEKTLGSPRAHRRLNENLAGHLGITGQDYEDYKSQFKGPDPRSRITRGLSDQLDAAHPRTDPYEAVTRLTDQAQGLISQAREALGVRPGQAGEAQIDPTSIRQVVAALEGLGARLQQAQTRTESGTGPRPAAQRVVPTADTGTEAASVSNAPENSTITRARQLLSRTIDMTDLQIGALNKRLATIAKVDFEGYRGRGREATHELLAKAAPAGGSGSGNGSGRPPGSSRPEGADIPGDGVGRIVAAVDRVNATLKSGLRVTGVPGLAKEQAVNAVPRNADAARKAEANRPGAAKKPSDANPIPVSERLSPKARADFVKGLPEGLAKVTQNAIKSADAVKQVDAAVELLRKGGRGATQSDVLRFFRNELNQTDDQFKKFKAEVLKGRNDLNLGAQVPAINESLEARAAAKLAASAAKKQRKERDEEVGTTGKVRSARETQLVESLGEGTKGLLGELGELKRAGADDAAIFEHLQKVLASLAAEMRSVDAATGKTKHASSGELQRTLREASASEGVKLSGSAARDVAHSVDLKSGSAEEANASASAMARLKEILAQLDDPTKDLIAELRALATAEKVLGGYSRELHVQQQEVLHSMAGDMRQRDPRVKGGEIKSAFERVTADAGAPVNATGLKAIAESMDLSPISAASIAKRVKVPEGGVWNALSPRLFGDTGFVGRQLRSAGEFITRFVSGIIVYGIGNAIQDALTQAVETQSTFVQVSEALNQTGRDTAGLRGQLSGLSQEYGVALRDVYTTAAGLTGLFDKADSGNAGLVGMTRVAVQLQLISRGALNATEAMRSLTSITSAYGDTTPQQIADIATVIQNRLSVNIEETIEGMARLSGQTAEMGLNAEHAAVYVASISKFTGQTGAGAGEQFSRILSSLQTSRTQGVVQRTYADAGVDLAPAFAKRDYTTILDTITAKYGQLNAAQQDVVATAIGGQRQAASINAIFADGSRILDTLTEAENSHGAAEQRAQKISEQLAAMLEKLRASFVNLFTNLADAGALDAFGAVVKGLVEGLGLANDVLIKFTNLLDAIPGARTVVGLVSTVVGMTVAVAIARKGWRGLTEAINDARLAVDRLAHATSGVGVTATAATGAVGAGAKGSARKVLTAEERAAETPAERRQRLRSRPGGDDPTNGEGPRDRAARLRRQLDEEKANREKARAEILEAKRAQYTAAQKDRPGRYGVSGAARPRLEVSEDFSPTFARRITRRGLEQGDYDTRRFRARDQRGTLDEFGVPRSAQGRFLAGAAERATGFSDSLTARAERLAVRGNEKKGLFSQGPGKPLLFDPSVTRSSALFGQSLRGLSGATNVAAKGMRGLSNVAAAGARSGFNAAGALGVAGAAGSFFIAAQEQQRARKETYQAAFDARFGRPNTVQEKNAEPLSQLRDADQKNRQKYIDEPAYKRIPETALRTLFTGEGVKNIGKAFLDPKNMGNPLAAISAATEAGFAGQVGDLPDAVRKKQDGLEMKALARFGDLSRNGGTEEQIQGQLEATRIGIEEQVRSINEDKSLTTEQKQAAAAEADRFLTSVTLKAEAMKLTAAKLNKADLMSVDQITKMGEYASTLLGASNSALTRAPKLFMALVNNMGFADTSTAQNESKKIISAVTTPVARRAAGLELLKSGIDQGTRALETLGVGDDNYDKILDKTLALSTQYDALVASDLQSKVDYANNMAALAGNSGNLAGSVAQMEEALKVLRAGDAEAAGPQKNEAYVPGARGDLLPDNQLFTAGDPEVAAAGKVKEQTQVDAINQQKIKLANRGLQIANSSTTSQTSIARNVLAMANNTLNIYKKGGGTADQIADATIAANQATLALTDKEREDAITMMAPGDNVAILKRRLDNATVDRDKYAKGSKEYKDANVKVTEASRNYDAGVADRTRASSDLQAAIFDSQGLTTKAAQERLNQLNVDLKNLLKLAGGDKAKSAEIDAKRAQILAATTTRDQSITEERHADDALRIALLNFAGKSVEAADAALDAAKEDLAEGLRKSGGERTAEVKNLEAAAKNAEANARDVKFQKAMGDIDFDLEMKRITSQGAIARYQAMLKDKSNTDEMNRTLMLKIKGLQDNLNAAVGTSQFNLGNFKLPTVYEVRRSLGVDAYGDIMTENVKAIGEMRKKTGSGALTGAGGVLDSIGGGSTVNDNSVHTLTLNGVSFEQVVDYIERYYGNSKSAAGTRAPSGRKAR